LVIFAEIPAAHLDPRPCAAGKQYRVRVFSGICHLSSLVVDFFLMNVN
jgi:hypothetical protein